MAVTSSNRPKPSTDRRSANASHGTSPRWDLLPRKPYVGARFHLRRVDIVAGKRWGCSARDCRAGGILRTSKCFPPCQETRRFGRPPTVEHDHLLGTRARSRLILADELARILRQLLEAGNSTKLSS